jgi:DNA-binding HxlR family transcriptional regulator
MKEKQQRRSDCPINFSLETFGDMWSLLIIRDLLFTDNRRFGDFATAGEAIATNVLTDRLELLECEGLILRRPDPADGRKFVYDLTRKGFDLAPVIIQMVIWAARHERTAAPPDLVREMERDPEKFVQGLRARWERSSARA